MSLALARPTSIQLRPHLDGRITHDPIEIVDGHSIEFIKYGSSVVHQWSPSPPDCGYTGEVQALVRWAYHRVLGAVASYTHTPQVDGPHPDPESLTGSHLKYVIHPGGRVERLSVKGELPCSNLIS